MRNLIITLKKAVYELLSKKGIENIYCPVCGYYCLVEMVGLWMYR